MRPHVVGVVTGARIDDELHSTSHTVAGIEGRCDCACRVHGEHSNDGGTVLVVSCGKRDAGFSNDGSPNLDGLVRGRLPGYANLLGVLAQPRTPVAIE